MCIRDSVISQAYPSIPEIDADGVFGTATRSAVVIFQSQFGLTPDGVIGQQTWNRIVEVYREVQIAGNLIGVSADEQSASAVSARCV